MSHNHNKRTKKPAYLILGAIAAIVALSPALFFFQFVPQFVRVAAAVLIFFWCGLQALLFIGVAVTPDQST